MNSCIDENTVVLLCQKNIQGKGNSEENLMTVILDSRLPQIPLNWTPRTIWPRYINSQVALCKEKFLKGSNWNFEICHFLSCYNIYSFYIIYRHTQNMIMLCQPKWTQNSHRKVPKGPFCPSDHTSWGVVWRVEGVLFDNFR